MTDPASILSALETILEEFFSPSCSNERKRVIEEQLNSFSRQSNACQLCVAFLHESHNPYALMFCVNLVEGVVQRSWLRMMSDEKAHVRKSVSELLLSSAAGRPPLSTSEVGPTGGAHPAVASAQLPPFVRNKLCKLLVDIGRFDWPHFYPDFFNYIFQLIHNTNTRLLGIVLLRTASEEFASPKDDLCASRKKELRQLLNSIVPQMLTTVTGVLDSILVSCQRSSSTPPPSPSHHSQQQNGVTLPSLNASSGRDSLGGHLLSMGRPLDPHRPLDSDARELALACLATLEHLTSWVSIGSNFGPSMLHTLFAFIALGCGDRSDLNSEVAVAAIGVVNELIYKKCFTQKDTQGCLAVVFQNTLETLQLVMTSASGGYSAARLHSLDEALIGKLAELVHILLDSHLARFPDEQPCEGAVHHFLQLAQVFIFGVPSPAQYVTCLDTWLSFLEQVETSRKAAKFKPLLATILREVLNKLLSERHPALLEMAARPAVVVASGAAQNDSEWECYLSKSLHLVSKISDVQLEETCGQVLSIWEPAIASFEAGKCSPASLRDLASLSRAVGCLSAALATAVPQHASHIAEVSVKLVGDLMRVVRHAETILAHHHHAHAEHLALIEALVQVECECLASIQSFLYLLSEILPTQHQAPPTQAAVGVRERTAMGIAELATEVLANCQSRGGVATGAVAAGVLVALTSIFRLPCFVEDLLPSLMLILSNTLCLPEVPNDSQRKSADHSFALQVASRCAIALQNICLLSVSVAKADDQRWELRGDHYDRLLSTLLTSDAMAEQAVDSAGNVVSANLTISSANNNLSRNNSILNKNNNNNNNNNSLLQQRPNSEQNIHHQQQSHNHHQLQQVHSTHSVGTKSASRTAIIVRKFRVAGAMLKAIGAAGGTVRNRARDRHATGWAHFLAAAAALIEDGGQEPAVSEAVIVFYISCAELMPLQKLEHSIERLIETASTSPALSFDTIDRKIEPYLEALLELFRVVVVNPSKGAYFLQRILDLGLRLWLKANPNPNSELRPVIIQLFHDVVCHHWRYFFPAANVASLLSASGSPPLDAVEHRAELVAILNAYGCCLLQPNDLETFALVLRSLGELQRKWKLFQRPIFRVAVDENECSLLAQFMGVLLRCLLQRSHDLLREEMLHTVFDMASTMPFEAFHQGYLPQFLMQIEQLDNYQREQLVRGFHVQSDMPSFTENLNSFLTDIRYYVVCNQALPPSSFAL